MSRNVAIWSGPTTANAFTIDQQANGDAMQLADGSYWVTWSDYGEGGPGTGASADVVGRRYDAAGAPLGEAIQLNSVLDVGAEYDPSMAATAGGDEFLIAYKASYVRGIVLEKRDTDGMATGSVAVYFISPLTGSNYSAGDPSVAVASETSAAVAYVESYSSPPFSSSSGIRLQLVEPSTMTLGTLVTVNSGGGSWSDPAVVALGDGRYLVTAKRTATLSSPLLTPDLFAWIYDPSTATLSNPVSIVSDAQETTMTPLLLDDGGVALVYRVDGEIAYRLFDSAFEPTGSGTLTGAGVDANSRISAAATGDGGLVVTWSTFDGAAYDIRAATIFADGTAQSAFTAIAEDVAQPLGISSIMLGDGRTLVTYDNGDDVRTVILDARDSYNTAPAYGPEGYQFGTPEGEKIKSAAANVYAGGGNDTLRENGAIFLSGGDGNDTIQLSSGALKGAGERTWLGDAGSDTLDAQALKSALTIDLTQGIGSQKGRGALAQVGGIEKIIGTVFGDTLTGDAAANDLSGSGGNDKLAGGAGQDRLTGGAGADRFVFADGDSAAKQGDADRIIDFRQVELDRIDLSAIDANSKKSNDQAFSWIGSGAYTRHAGELRSEAIGGVTYVMGDTNGDGRADFTIRLDGLVAVTASDFSL